MSTSTPAIYHNFKTALRNNTIAFSNLHNMSLKAALCQTSSNCQDLTLDTFSQITNEVANGNGYTSGGRDIFNMTWADNDAGVLTLSGDNPTWNATGSFSYAHIVLYDTTTDILFCTAVADYTSNVVNNIAVTADKLIEIQFPGNVIYTFS